MVEQNEARYAVFAEAEGHDKPLLQLDLTFARLMDDIVVPYQNDELFFLDGAPLSAQKLRRIKILRLSEQYAAEHFDFQMSFKGASPEVRRIYGEQYGVRFENILRANSEDVTSQIIKAYNRAIKPNIKDYLPKRDDLISAAAKIFVEGVKALGS
jgi:hypothetical protein